MASFFKYIPRARVWSQRWYCLIARIFFFGYGTKSERLPSLPLCILEDRK